jgi:hypothetical protein
MPCFLTVGRATLVQSLALSRLCEPHCRPTAIYITRRRRGQPQRPAVPQPIPGQEQDETGAKYLMRRVLNLLSEPAAVL